MSYPLGKTNPTYRRRSAYGIFITLRTGAPKCDEKNVFREEKGVAARSLGSHTVTDQTNRTEFDAAVFS